MEGVDMATGERYSNGLLEGFLFGRGQLAMGYILEHVSGNATLPKPQLAAWEEVVAYASDALSEYQENGDSERVKELTGLMIDATDRAISFRKA
jgi:hypothetical protein